MDERRIEYLPLAELVANPANPKEHALDDLDSSISRFGYVDPVVLDERTGMLIAGHGRAETLRRREQQGQPPPNGVKVDKTGRWLAPVVRGWASTDDREASAMLIASNQLTIKGGWNDSALASLLDDLHRNSAIDGVGMSAAEIEELVAVAAYERRPPSSADPDEVGELPPEPRCKIGDLWLLGEHRLFCGDARDDDSYQRLLGGHFADVVWTDPPYGVEYVGKTKAALTFDGDRPDGVRALVQDALTAARPHVKLGTQFRLAAEAAGWTLHQVLVWVKDVFVLGHSNYHYQHEDILHGWLPGGEGRSGRGGSTGSRWTGGNDVSTVFQIPRPKRSESHPTMKPVALIEAHLVNSSKVGHLVLDMFAGSGSTLIAAHRLGRRAALIELTPTYCDVICERYQQLTGDRPVLESTSEATDFGTGPAESPKIAS